MMTQRAFVGATLGVLALMVVPSGVLTQGAKDIVVQGSVLDSRGDGLVGVQVEVWRQGKSESKPTEKDGSYKFTMASGPLIDQIRYSRSDLDPAVVDRLSGRRDQQISKVMYKTGETRPLTATVEQLHAFELLLTPWFLQPQVRDSMSQRLKEIGPRQRLAQLPLPDSVPEGAQDLLEALKRRKAELNELYQRRGF